MNLFSVVPATKYVRLRPIAITGAVSQHHNDVRAWISFVSPQESAVCESQLEVSRTRPQIQYKSHYDVSTVCRLGFLKMTHSSISRQTVNYSLTQRSCKDVQSTVHLMSDITTKPRANKPFILFSDLYSANLTLKLWFRCVFWKPYFPK